MPGLKVIIESFEFQSNWFSLYPLQRVCLAMVTFTCETGGETLPEIPDSCDAFSRVLPGDFGGYPQKHNMNMSHCV